MAQKIGDVVRIGGIRYTIDGVDFDEDNKTTFFLKRNFDGSRWYAKCRRVTRFTGIRRRFDIDHANLDKTDVMYTANKLVWRD